MSMTPVLSRLAWRYLWRNHRRTIIMLSAIAVGSWAMIFMTALSRGMVDQMIRDGISVLPGHVQVHDPEFLNDPSVANRITIPDRELAASFDTAGFRAWGEPALHFQHPALLLRPRPLLGDPFSLPSGQ